MSHALLKRAERASGRPAQPTRPRAAARPATGARPGESPQIGARHHDLAAPSAPTEGLDADELDLSGARRILTRLGPGRPLESWQVPAGFAGAANVLARVRLHDDAVAHDIATGLGAKAFTVGPHIGVRRGESLAGRGRAPGLLGHELTHVIQQFQAAATSRSAQERQAEGVARGTHVVPRGPLRMAPRLAIQRSPDKIERIEIDLDTKKFIVYTDIKGRERLEVSISTSFEPRSYEVWWEAGNLQVDPAPQTEKGSLLLKESKDHALIVRLVKAIPKDAPVSMVVRGGAGNTDAAAGEGGAGESTDAAAEGGGGTELEGAAAREAQAEVPAGVPLIRVSSEAEIRELEALGVIEAELSTRLQGRIAAGEALSFEEARALLEGLIERVALAEARGERAEGSSWLELARFVEKHAAVLGGKSGLSEEGLSMAEVEKIIEIHERFVGVEEGVGEVESVADYDPRKAEDWNALQDWERELWTDFMDKYGSSWTGSDGGSVALTPDVRFRMAFRMSPQHMNKGAREAIIKMMKDPIFWSGLFAGVALYLALWVVPEPIISKSVAVAITSALLALFTASELYNLGVAWSNLKTEAGAAQSLAALEEAAKRFGHAVGETGGRILITLILILGSKTLPTPTAPTGGLPPTGLATAEGFVLSEGLVAVQVTADGAMVAVAGGGGRISPTLHALSEATENGGGGSGDANKKGGRAPEQELSSDPDKTPPLGIRIAGGRGIPNLNETSPGEFRVTWSDAPGAWFNFKVWSSDWVELSYINNGGRSGEAASMIVEGLRYQGTARPTRLTGTRVINQRTITDIENGVPLEETTLGRLRIEIVRELGGKVESMRTVPLDTGGFTIETIVSY